MLLGRVTIDTTGFAFGTVFAILLKDVNLGDFGTFGTDFAGWETTQGNTLAIDNGSVRIVPEPSTFVLMFAGIAGLGIVAVARRKRNA